MAAASPLRRHLTVFGGQRDPPRPAHPVGHPAPKANRELNLPTNPDRPEAARPVLGALRQRSLHSATIPVSMQGLKGKNVLVTGASSGIGRSVAVRFANEGCAVAVNYRSPAELDDANVTVAEITKSSPGARFMLVEGDVSEEVQVQRMFGAVIEELGRLDILINNAGIQQASPSHELTLEAFNRILSVNLNGTFLCSREAIRHFLSRPGGGAIVNNTSVHEIIPKPQYLSYSASKGAIGNLTKTLALEYASAGIRVNCVGPGAVITPINNAWIDDPPARAVVESHIPMGRAATPAEIASVFAFLASDEAAYITGQTIYACGGLTLYAEFRTTWSS
jgi:glucose 1-dehydrogenase